MGVVTKVRRNFSLDASVADWIDSQTNASAAANAALIAAMEVQAEHDALAQLVAALNELHGAPDPAKVDHFVALMGGKL